MLALPGPTGGGVLSLTLAGLKSTLIDSGGSEAFGSPMGSTTAADREKSRTPDGGRPARRRRVAARPGGGPEATEWEEDPIMGFSETEPGSTEEAQRLAGLIGTVPALPGSAAAAGPCG